MMIKYETENLILKMLEKSEVGLLIDFLKRNAEEFSRYEVRWPENYLTRDYQKVFIEGCKKQFLKGDAYRYYLFEKHGDGSIVGCVGLNGINLGEEKSAKIFYKLDREAMGKGYAVEACECILREARRELKLHRIEADICPGNDRSMRTAERLGFEYEGMAKSAHRIGDEWVDHKRYALVFN